VRRPNVSKRESKRSRTPARSSLPDVVLVDDDALVRTALGRLLRGAGFNVTAYENPSDVLLNPPPRDNTCLILDIYMPEMSGVQLWRELQARGIEIPTILITGQRDAQAELFGEQIHAVAVLYKPVEEKELFETLKRAPERPAR
jgi:two-component system, LuxR family, response regulator FixJ